MPNDGDVDLTLSPMKVAKAAAAIAKQPALSDQPPTPAPVVPQAPVPEPGVVQAVATEVASATLSVVNVVNAFRKSPRVFSFTGKSETTSHTAKAKGTDGGGTPPAMPRFTPPESVSALTIIDTARKSESNERGEPSPKAIAGDDVAHWHDVLRRYRERSEATKAKRVSKQEASPDADLFVVGQATDTTQAGDDRSPGSAAADAEYALRAEVLQYALDNYENIGDSVELAEIAKHIAERYQVYQQEAVGASGTQPTESRSDLSHGAPRATAIPPTQSFPRDAEIEKAFPLPPPPTSQGTNVQPKGQGSIVQPKASPIVESKETNAEGDILISENDKSSDKSGLRQHPIEQRGCGVALG